jgi:hypothetical protein
MASHHREWWRPWGYSNEGTWCSKHMHNLIILPFLTISRPRLVPMVNNDAQFVSQQQPTMLRLLVLCLLQGNTCRNTMQDIINVSAAYHFIMLWQTKR